MIEFDWGAALLGFLMLQRIAELWWTRQKERRLLAAGGVEYGRSHLVLIVFLHAAWLIGMWVLAYDRPVEPQFFVIVAILQIARFWVLATLGRRWTIRIIVVPGEKLVARGPYRWLRHPNYTVVTGEIAAVPLALGLPLCARLHHSQRRGSCGPHPSGERGAGDNRFLSTSVIAAVGGR